MTEHQGSIAENKQGRAWVWLVIGCILFGVLMALRDAVHSMWLRAAIAGSAFAALGLFAIQFRKARASSRDERKT